MKRLRPLSSNFSGDAKVANALHAAQSAAHAYRLKVSGSVLAFGAIIFSASQTCFILYARNIIDVTPAIMGASNQVGQFLMLLALQPGDKLFSVLAAILLVVLCIYMVSSFPYTRIGELSTFDRWRNFVLLGLELIFGSCFGAALLWRFKRKQWYMSARGRIDYLWALWRVSAVSYSVLEIVSAIIVVADLCVASEAEAEPEEEPEAEAEPEEEPEAEAEPEAEPEAEVEPESDAEPEVSSSCRRRLLSWPAGEADFSSLHQLDARQLSPEPEPMLDPSDAGAVATTFALYALVIVLALVATRNNRRRIHRLLGRLEQRGEVRAAATISTFLNGMDPKVAIKKAEQSFRGLSFDQLRQADLVHARKELREDGDSLSKHSTPRPLGSVHCFLSHSWNDPAPPKYAALKLWAAEFEKLNKQTPVVWLDKVSHLCSWLCRLLLSSPPAPPLSLPRLLTPAPAQTLRTSLRLASIRRTLRAHYAYFRSTSRAARLFWWPPGRHTRRAWCGKPVSIPRPLFLTSRLARPCRLLT